MSRGAAWDQRPVQLLGTSLVAVLALALLLANVEVQIGTTHIRHPVGGGLEGKQRKVL